MLGRTTAPRHRVWCQREATATDWDVKTAWAGNPVQSLVQWVYEWVVSMLQPSVVRVPDVRGVYTGVARHQLRMLGLRVKAPQPGGPVIARRVRAQDPAPGTDAKRGTVVTLYLVPDEGVGSAF